MTSKTKTFYYQGAFKDYIKQFLRIFSGFQVEINRDDDGDGGKDLMNVVVHYGDMDRIVGNVLHKEGTFVPNVLPLMTGVETSIELNPENRRNKYHEESVGMVRASDGARISHNRRIGVPYRLGMDLSIITSNKTQMFQILEQILLMFTPKLILQKSDNLIDWSYITEVELVAINPESNVPAGVDERFISYSLSFLVDIWLDYPSREGGVIEEIIVRILDNTNDSAGVELENFTVNSN